VNLLGPAERVMRALDGWQRRHERAGVPYGVIKKFSDDNANLLVVSLAWYGFTAIFPLLLVVVTVFGFIGQKSIGAHIVNTLHNFPVIGHSFNPANPAALHGSTLGLIIGLIGLLYGAQGVTQTAQQAMATVWNIPQVQRTGFLPRLGRSVSGLFTIGITFVLNAFASGYATATGHHHLNIALRVLIVLGLAVLNVGLYYASFVVLTGKGVAVRPLLPGAITGAIGFTALITIGTGLATHQLNHTSDTYGTFGTVIGIVAFLLLLAKITMYGAELNPRALPLGGEPTAADQRVLADLVHAEQRREDQAIGVGFGEDAAAQASADARRRWRGWRRQSAR
jgi:uncharacterized BrkB/YihY/UPF0761 family membrane protein